MQSIRLHRFIMLILLVYAYVDSRHSITDFYGFTDIYIYYLIKQLNSCCMTHRILCLLTSQIRIDAFVKLRQRFNDVFLRALKTGCNPIGNHGKTAVHMVANDAG